MNTKINSATDGHDSVAPTPKRRIRIRGEPIAYADNDPGLVSLFKWRKQIGRSASGVYAWIKKGLLKTVIVQGKPFLTTAEIRRFTAAAERGEFAKPYVEVRNSAGEVVATVHYNQRHTKRGEKP